MTQVHIVAINLAKRSFQVCGTDRGGAVLSETIGSAAPSTHPRWRRFNLRQGARLASRQTSPID
jgi:hypothetical protein